jgi:hypothetical protein
LTCLPLFVLQQLLHLNTKSLLARSHSSIDLIYSSEYLNEKRNVRSITSYNNLSCNIESNPSLTFHRTTISYVLSLFEKDKTRMKDLRDNKIEKGHLLLSSPCYYCMCLLYIPSNGILKLCPPIQK